MSDCLNFNHVFSDLKTLINLNLLAGDENVKRLNLIKLGNI